MRHLLVGMAGILGLALSVAAQSVQIVAPAEGIVLAKGATTTIRWTATSIVNPQWVFFLNIGPNMTFLQSLGLSASQVAPGVWEAPWAVPASLSADSYYDVVVKDDASVIDDHSGFFSICAAAPDAFIDTFTFDAFGSAPQCNPVSGAAYDSCCDSGIWKKVCGDNPDQCIFKYDNVLVTGGVLSLLTLPTAPPQGGQIDSTQEFGFGSYRASIRASAATLPFEGVVNGFYYYNGDHGEIDVEILSKESPHVRFTVHKNPELDPHPQHQLLVPLCFDPTSGFHTYGFDWYSDHVAFFVDPEENPLPVAVIHQDEIAIPTLPGTLSLNNWADQGCLLDPLNCFSGLPPGLATTMDVDWVSFEPLLPKHGPVLTAGCSPVPASGNCNFSVSTLAGGSRLLTVRAGKEHAGKLYFVLGSVSGPCTPTIVKGKTLPLTLDPYFSLTFTFPNSVLLMNSLSSLDSNGNGVCTFNLPALVATAFVGLEVSHAALIASTGGQVVAATNAVTLRLDL